MLRSSITLVLLLAFQSALHAEPPGLSTSSAEPVNTIESPARPQNRDIREQLEAWLESETVDPEWSAVTEKRLRASFGDTAKPDSFEIVELTCKTSLCRFRVLFSNLTAFEDFMNDAHSWFGFSMQGSVELETGAGAEALAHFFLLRDPTSS